MTKTGKGKTKLNVSKEQYPETVIKGKLSSKQIYVYI